MRDALVALAFSCVIMVPALSVVGSVRALAADVATTDPAPEHHSVMTYVGAVIANLVYFPTKAVFAQVGALTSGLVWAVTLGDTRTANIVWDTTTGGNYIVTPSMIEGKDYIRFTGEY